MNRQPFKQRSVLMRTDKQVEVAKNILDNIPLDADSPIEMVLREYKPARSLDANSRYWAMLHDISEQLWASGKQFDTETWHEYLKRKLMPDIIVVKGGEQRSKWVEEPDGKMRVISTTQLNKSSFGEYMDEVAAFGAGQGVMFHTNQFQQ